MAVTYRETRTIRLTELVPFPGNARRGNIPKIREALRALGQFRTLLVRETNGQLVVLAGNQTRFAMLAEGWDEARCELVECSDLEAVKVNLADNRLSDLATDDDIALGGLFSYLEGDYTATGWEPETAAAFMGSRSPDPPGGLGDPDDIPDEDPVDPQTERGMVYRLGHHLLMCGDATKRDDVRTLMAGQRAPIMVTDPPYGVAYHANKKGQKAASIAGDLTQSVIPVGFAVAVEIALDGDARIYMFGGTSNWGMYSSLFDHHLRMQPRPIVWVKEGFILRPNHYHSQFEMVYFGWKGTGGGMEHWYGDRSQSDVWKVTRDRDRVHPTQKPVEVCAAPIRNSCPADGLVYDPFGGSGSTLIAAHMLGRPARIMELDPKYCDVICRRWAQFTNQIPERVLGDGKTEPVTFA
jgi:DNA modification methylase